MRILLTNTGPWGTGSGTIADGIVQELIKRGHEVKAFFPDSGFSGTDYEKYYSRPDLYRIVPFPVTYKGVYLYTFPLIIPDPNPRNYPKAWTFKDLSDIELKTYFDYIKDELVKLLGEFRPNVIECQHIWAIDHVLGNLGYSYICVAHHSDQMGFRYDHRMSVITKESSKRAEYIFCISDYVRQEVIELYGIAQDKAITIPGGYDQSIFYPFKVDREEVFAEFDLKISDDKPVITFCGKLCRTKGIDILLQANHIIQKKSKALILLIGSGSLMDCFNKGEHEKFCLENVVFLGHLSQQKIARLHNIARLSVLPSRSEGFGIAALEAMGCGLPVVASRVGGLVDFVEGDLVEPENPAALADAVIRLIEMQDEEYNQIRQKAIEKANNYSFASLVDTRMPYYNKVAQLNKKLI